MIPLMQEFFVEKVMGLVHQAEVYLVLLVLLVLHVLLTVIIGGTLHLAIGMALS